MVRQELVIKTSIIKGYQIDSLGNVFNKKGIKTKLVTSGKYLSFNIRTDTRNPTRSFVHKLQAFVKYGEKIFEDKIVVRHLNGNSLDNSWNNIAIGSQSENMLDIPKEKRIIYASNPKHNHVSIINDINMGLTYKDVMLKYNITSKGTISYIFNKSLKANNII